MPEDPLLQINAVTPLQADEDLCKIANLSELLQVLVRHLGVNAGRVLELSSVITTATEPGESDRDKVWINPTSQFIGFFTGSRWDKIYLWPILSPFKYCSEGDTPPELRELSDATISQENLGANTDDCKWVIFDPDSRATI